MRYADSHCKYKEEYSPEHVYYFTGPDVLTGKSITVRVKASELYKYRQGEYIQNALLSNSPEEREFLLSGISNESWENIFKEQEDLED